jgi:iron complex transport system substrate-binding protein
MRKQLLIGVLAGVLFVSACGDDDDDAASETTAPTVDTADPAETTIPGTDAAPGTTGSPATTEAPATTEPPATTETSGTTTSDTVAGEGAARIVSISPALTEILFAIGAGDQVVAVDDFSNYPAEVLELPNELSGYEPNIEAIAAYEPDLVVASTQDVVAPLEALGIEVFVGPSAPTLEDSYTQMEQLGALTGHIGDAAEVIANMQSDIQAIIDEAPELEAPLTVYHELTTDYYSADSTTFIGQAYALLGLQNIADQVEGDNGGYPQLNAETIITDDPDLIFLADTKFEGQTLETVAARPGWDAIAAVQNGDVFEMDDDIASRWGPRFVDYMQQVADAIEQAAAVPAGG